MNVIGKTLRRWLAMRRIPDEAHRLCGTINRRYVNWDFSGGEFRVKSKQGKLALFIKKVNRDPEIARLHALAPIGSIIVFSQFRNTSAAGWGCNLCIGEKGLFIYDWNDYGGKHDDIPASPESFEQLGLALDCETLRGAIVNYTHRENYVQHVADFQKFVPA